eukprot:4297775-Amphidinium_carterae.1
MALCNRFSTNAAMYPAHPPPQCSNLLESIKRCPTSVARPKKSEPPLKAFHHNDDSRAIENICYQKYKIWSCGALSDVYGKPGPWFQHAMQGSLWQT